MEFLRVPGGTFQMGDVRGDGADDEGPVRPVTLDGFFMGKYPVTQKAWQTVMPENPSRYPGLDRPVEQVAFTEVMDFIDRLNAGARGQWCVALPTEAQWEYAARSGGRDERFAGGEAVRKVAWIDADDGDGTRPVGQKAPNALGLYDMSGNVWEFCRDVYAADAYARLADQNPLCAGPGTDRVIRGGCWHLDAWSARCTRRMAFPEDMMGPGLGFRLVFRPAATDELIRLRAG
jgi:formylglycine-generating enzyme required for sulfatase activity